VRLGHLPDCSGGGAFHFDQLNPVPTVWATSRFDLNGQLAPALSGLAPSKDPKEKFRGNQPST
jgi:hypothetical protein